MIIKATDTIRKVFETKGALLTLCADEFNKQIRDARLPEYIKDWKGKKIYPKYEPLELTGCTMFDLREMEFSGSIEENFESVMRVQFGVTKEKMLRLPYLKSMQVYIQTIETSKKIFDKFNSLDFPMSSEEREAQVIRRSLGIFDLVRTFCKLMPQYKIKDAWGLDWELIFVELEANRAEILTQRNYQKIMERKH